MQYFNRQSQDGLDFTQIQDIGAESDQSRLCNRSHEKTKENAEFKSNRGYPGSAC